MIPLTAGELASEAAELLTDTCTLESPDRTQATGWKTEATGIACRLVDPAGQERATAGGLVNVQTPRVEFLWTQTLAVGWRITVTNKGNREIKIDSIVEPHGGAFQYAVAKGTR